MDLTAVRAALAAFERACTEGPLADRPLGERFRWLTAPRSAIVQPGPVHGGITADPAAELDRLFTTLVSTYRPGTPAGPGTPAHPAPSPSRNVHPAPSPTAKRGRCDIVHQRAWSLRHRLRSRAAADRDRGASSRVRGLLARYPELAAVLAAAIIGLSVQRPLAWLAARQGINVLLAVLVFATAVTIEPAALRRAAAAWRPLLAALAIGVTVLPALAWAAARMVPAGPLRDGVLTVGLAPCEIASVATTAMAGGEAAVAAGLLIGSTVAAVAVAGPILALEAGHAGFSPGGVIGNLALVVALPLAVGIALRASAGPAADVRAERSPRASAPPAAGVGAEQAPTRISLRAWLSATTRALATPRAQRIASHVALAASPPWSPSSPPRFTSPPATPRWRPPSSSSCWRPPSSAASWACAHPARWRPPSCSPRQCGTSRSQRALPRPPSARPPPPRSACTASSSWSGAPPRRAPSAAAPPSPE